LVVEKKNCAFNFAVTDNHEHFLTVKVSQYTVGDLASGLDAKMWP